MTLDALRNVAAAVLFVAGLVLWTWATTLVEPGAGSVGTIASCEEGEVEAANQDAPPPCECPPSEPFPR